MNVTFSNKGTAWRGRGHPRRQVPQQVREMADRTYRTGEVGVVSVGADEEEDAAELKRLLTSYAKSRGLLMRFQRDDDVMRFEMADREPAAEGEAAA